LGYIDEIYAVGLDVEEKQEGNSVVAPKVTLRAEKKKSSLDFFKPVLYRFD
jgi:hypothetical protein